MGAMDDVYCIRHRCLSTGEGAIVSIWSDIVSALRITSGGDVGNTPGTAQDVSNVASAVTPLGDLGGALTAFSGIVGALADGSMWRSLGWILLGVLLIFLGSSLWLKSKNILPEVIPVPI